MNEHVHYRAVPPGRGRRFVLGIMLNAGFIVAEVLYGLKANSLMLLADASHNTVDVLALCIAWGATLLAQRKPSATFTYGFQSASIIALLTNTLFLMLVVGGIGWEAIQRFFSPEIPAPITVMVVATFGIIVNGITAWLFYHDSKHDLNSRGIFLDMTADAAISLGVVCSGLVLLKTGWWWFDPFICLVISAVIIISTWRLFKSAIRLAMHAVPEHVEVAKVKKYLRGLEGVSHVHDLHIWGMSTTEAALSVHLVMPGGHPGDAFIWKLESDLDEIFKINHSTIQIEVGDA